MTAQFMLNGLTVSGGLQSRGRSWVVSGPTRHDLTPVVSQTKLLFHEAFPASTSNRASHVYPPTPIVIERLLPPSEEPERVESTRSSVSFTTLSEERLRAAVRLAKRDMRRRRFESLAKSPAKPSQEASLDDTSDIELLQELTSTPDKSRLKTSSPKKKSTRSGSKLSWNTPQKHPICPMPRIGRSPPTRDFGPRQFEGCRHAPLSQAIGKLQHELELYIHKVEALSNRGGELEEHLEPEEEDKLEVRRQKQACRSARVIYVLQQQVKEIQEDIEKLQSQNMWHTKKSTTINRLAAAHRGTLRVLQAVVNQLSDRSRGKVPPYHRELSQLIRQLSLCSAKVEAEQGSEMALGILQKLETLDSAVHKQQLLEKMQAQARPPRRTSPHRSTSPTSAPKGPGTSTVRGPRKPANPKRAIRGKRVTSQKPRAASQQLMNRREALRAGLQSLAQRELQERPQTNTTCRKPSSSPPKQVVNDASGPELSSERMTQAQNEALRNAWLEKMTTQRLKELDQLSKEEAQRIQTLRSEMVSPSQWAESAAQKARERIQPLLDQAKQIGGSRPRTGPSLRTRLSEPAAERAAGSAEQLSEALLEDLLEDTARAAWTAETDGQSEATARSRLQAPTLESMLLRMEEIQTSRFHRLLGPSLLGQSRSSRTPVPCSALQASLSSANEAHKARTDPELFGRFCPGGTCGDGDFCCCAPKLSSSSIITRRKHSVLSENSLTDEASRDEQQPRRGTVFPGPAERSAGTAISVPGGMLGNIRQYREDYETYLRVAAREAVGSFNPWAVADRLAEELLSEALADVAAEFQDVVEEYAEAVFTSEFLQPTQSPPASAPVSRHDVTTS
ncbi:Protein moonraker [Liparis tanakae]|uniref:Protein moonraker n=1 Tax=Liparis tanakae TaxID=230148 RepID=A0A4Z2HJS2_9TELE|nr:Protein moonraker [Liparis tanakae]